MKTDPRPVTSSPLRARALVHAAFAVAVRPSLWATALRQMLVLAAPAWWRRRPFLPLPDAAYVAFRLQAMYGDPRHQPVPADVVTYLRWCRGFRQSVRRER
ncbi:MAG: hypothetical protein M3N68_06220 [Actinomycetota bacterium]|nr:hypothetical protein [Actinomycetota bacterium]